ncbi:MAG: hypothetical protein WCA77_08530 [Thermoplasmata archaeon]
MGGGRPWRGAGRERAALLMVGFGVFVTFLAVVWLFEDLVQSPLFATWPYSVGLAVVGAILAIVGEVWFTIMKQKQETPAPEIV